MAIRTTPVSHQVVELKAGKHTSPDRGACVVELASMLAGERFSDHPRSVCPVVAGYMRTLNDEVGDGRRQELLPYASKIVGTRASKALSAQRARLCLDWAAQLGARRRRRLPRFLGRWIGGEQEGRLCAKAALRHSLPVALTLADALVALGEQASPGGSGMAMSPPYPPSASAASICER